MSVKVMTAVWDHSRAKGSALLLLLAIADNANDYGLAWPGIETLAQRTRIGKRATIKQLEKLEKTGELMIYRRSGQHNHYILNVNATDEMRAAAISALAAKLGESVEAIKSGLLPLVNPSSPVTESSLVNSSSPVEEPTGERQFTTTGESGFTRSINGSDDDESPDPEIQDHQTNKRAWDDGTRELVAAAWKGMGLSKALREMLLKRDPEMALGLVYHARGEAKTNAAGLLRTMLENGDEPMAKYTDRAAWGLASEPVTGDGSDPRLPVDAMYAEIAARFGPLVAESMRQAEEQRAASEPAPSEPPPEVLALDEVGPGQKTSMRSAWLAVMGQLELQLNRSTFDTWLRRAEPVRFADGVLMVKVRHAYAPDYLPQHFPDIDEMVTRAAGIPVKVAYECDVKLFNHNRSPAPAESGHD